MENTVKGTEEVKPRGKASRIFFGISLVYSLLSFLFYIALDVIKVRRDGWTAANVVVTVFLALQIVMYVVFLAAGAGKEQKKAYKAGKKSLKIAKKAVTKALALATSAAVIAGAGSDPGVWDIIALAVAALALAMTVTEIIWRVVLFVLARKLKKAVRSKLGAKEGESLGAAAKAKAAAYISSAKRKPAEQKTELAAAERKEAAEPAPQKSASEKLKEKAVILGGKAGEKARQLKESAGKKLAAKKSKEE